MNKADIFALVRGELESQLEVMTASQLEVQAGMTHADNRSEGDKDTRATESSYLARGQANRVVERGAELAALDAAKLREFGADSPIAVSALVTLEDSDGVDSHYFLLPGAGGVAVESDGLRVTVVTSQSPIGRALLGKRLDDDVDIRTPQGVRECTVADVA